MEFFFKSKPEAPKPPASRSPNDVWVDHDTGLIHGLPGGPQPLVGPTTGAAYQELKKNEAKHKQEMHLLKRQILSTYQCIQCKRKQPGAFVRMKWEIKDGVNMQLLVCRNPKCDGPVVLIEDAMSLTRPPMGKI